MTILIWLWDLMRSVEKKLNALLLKEVKRLFSKLTCQYFNQVINQGLKVESYIESIKPYSKVLIYRWNGGNNTFFIKKDSLAVKYHEKEPILHAKLSLLYRALIFSIVLLEEMKNNLKNIIQKSASKKLRKDHKNKTALEAIKKVKRKADKTILYTENAKIFLEGDFLRKTKFKNEAEINDVFYKIKIKNEKNGELFKNTVKFTSDDREVKLIVYTLNPVDFRFVEMLQGDYSYEHLFEVLEEYKIQYVDYVDILRIELHVFNETNDYRRLNIVQTAKGIFVNVYELKNGVKSKKRYLKEECEYLEKSFIE